MNMLMPASREGRPGSRRSALSGAPSFLDPGVPAGAEPPRPRPPASDSAADEHSDVGRPVARPIESERQIIATGGWVWAWTRRTSAAFLYFVAGRPQDLVLHRRDPVLAQVPLIRCCAARSSVTGTTSPLEQTAVSALFVTKYFHFWISGRETSSSQLSSADVTSPSQSRSARHSPSCSRHHHPCPSRSADYPSRDQTQ